MDIIQSNIEHDPDAIPTSRGLRNTVADKPTTSHGFCNPLADKSLTSRGFCNIVAEKLFTIGTSNPSAHYS
jgi:hypothetical protein